MKSEENGKMKFSEDLHSSAERLQLQRAIEKAEQDIAEGRWVEHSEVMEKLKRWSAGDFNR